MNSCYWLHHSSAKRCCLLVTCE